MVDFPNAKINLGLYITSKRTDGYHNILTCFYPIDWKEALEIIPSTTFSFTQSGITIPGSSSTNLVIQAYDLLKKHYDLPPVSMHLHKCLPIGAGLGGGSSDAAYTLILLNKLFQLNISREKLIEFASLLGSDCAYFILNTPCIATSRGEVLTPLNMSLQGYHLLMVHPGIHISTKEAYEGVTPRACQEELEQLLQQAPSAWKGKLHNQFEEHLFTKLPELARIKEKLYEMGADYASMSGSGSALFGIFKNKPKTAQWPEHYKIEDISL